MVVANVLELPPQDLDDGLDVAPLDDLSVLRPEIRAAIERAEEAIRTGTARLIPHGQIQHALEEMRRQHDR